VKLIRLCKSADSSAVRDCPTMYLGEDPTVMVSQGKLLDAETAGQMQYVAHDETGVAIPTETVLRAAGLFLAAQGRPSVAAVVEAFLATWDGGRQ